MMKAVIQSRYGPPEVLQFAEIEKPVPTENQALIEVRAVSLNRSDWESLVGKPLYARLGGLFSPGERIPGSDIAGRVLEVGSEVGRFRPGDEVFGETLTYQGGLAEYVCVSEKALALKPDWLTYEQAASIPQAATIALQGICTQGKVQAGQRVLVNGAGGGGGSLAIQLAKLAGAEVTGVDHGGKLEFMRSLGADHVVDFQRQDFTRQKKQYDLILDLVATRPVFSLPRALTPGGTYFFVGGSVATIFQILLLGPMLKRRTGKNIRMLVVQPGGENLVTITGLIQSGKIKPTICRQYTFLEAPEALRDLGQNRCNGKIVISLDEHSRL